MVKISVLADCLKSIYNAEKRGKRQVRRSSRGYTPRGRCPSLATAAHLAVSLVWCAMHAPTDGKREKRAANKSTRWLLLQRCLRPVAWSRLSPPPHTILQVLIRPCSKVIVKFLQVMQKHGELLQGPTPIRRDTDVQHAQHEAFCWTAA